MLISKLFVDEISKMLAMDVEDLKKYVSGTRNIPFVPDEGFKGEKASFDDDGVLAPTKAYTAFLNSQPEAGLLDLLSLPLMAKNWYNAGCVFLSQEMLDMSRKCFLYAAKIKPSYTDAWYNYGEVSFSKMKETIAGRLGYSKALECNPKDRDAVYNLGLVDLFEKKLNDAEKRFRQADVVGSDRGQAKYWLCITLHCLGKDDALTTVQKILSETELPVAVKVIRDIKSTNSRSIEDYYKFTQ